MSLAINSPIKLDLPVAPTVQEPALFNELLVAYRATRALHAAATQYYGVGTLSGQDLSSLSLTSLYLVNNLAKLTCIASEAITPGKFLGLTVSGGVFYAKHFRWRLGERSTSCIGIATQAAAAGEGVTVFTEGCVIEGYSGLTANTPYYAYDDGAFTDLYIAHPVGDGTRYPMKLCGYGLSETAMRIVLNA